MIAGAKRRGRASSFAFRSFLLLSLIVALTTLAVLVGQVLVDSQGFLDTTLLTSPPSALPEIAGARPAILASLYLGALVFLFSVPIGVATAVYLEEYAAKDRWYNRLLELNIQNLAGVPSIVYGILGLAFLVRGLGLGRTLLAGSLILTLLVLPTVIIASREALRSVPSSIRDGAYALGATPLAGDLAARCCRPPSPGSLPARSCRCRGRSARRRRCCWSGRWSYRHARPLSDQRFHRPAGPDLQLGQAAAAGLSVPRGRGYRGAARHAADAELRGNPAAQSLPEEMVR